MSNEAHPDLIAYFRGTNPPEIVNESDFKVNGIASPDQRKKEDQSSVNVFELFQRGYVESGTKETQRLYYRNI